MSHVIRSHRKPLTPNWPGQARTRFWTDVDDGYPSPPSIYRMRERVFIGDAVNMVPTRTDDNYANATVLFANGSDDGPNYLARDAQLLIMPAQGAVGIASLIVNDSAYGPAVSPPAIAGAFYAKHNRDSRSSWGLYVEVQQMGSLTNAAAIGMEMDVRNAGSSVTDNPYNTSSTGAQGIGIVGGGDTAYGPTSTNPSVSALNIARNGSYSFGAFNTGILIRANGIEGSTGADGEAADADAIALARGHAIHWYSSDHVERLTVRGSLNTTDPTASLIWTGSTVRFGGAGGAETFLITQTGTLANNLRVSAVATGLSPTLTAAGSDTDIDLTLAPKANGNVLTSRSLKAHTATAIPAGGTAGAGFMLSSTANFGVFFGSGAPSLSAAQGSLYSRSDGLPHYNTDGSTGWGRLASSSGRTTILPDSNSDAASTIGSGVDSVVISAVTTDANDWLVLPVPVVGTKIRGWSVVAHEMRTVASSNVTINGVDADGTNEAAIPATTYWEVDCVTSTAWILRAWDELGAPIAAIVPDP